MSKHSTDFKKQVVDQYLAGKDGTDSIGRQNGIPVSMVRTWVAFYSAHGLDGLTKKFFTLQCEFQAVRATASMGKYGLRQAGCCSVQYSLCCSDRALKAQIS